MGITKTEIYTSEQNYLSTLLKAIAHPARIAILQHIIAAEACICGELVDELGLAQATISQHLKALKDAGIIHGNIDGVKICYCINPATWALLKNIFGEFLDSYKVAPVCC